MPPTEPWGSDCVWGVGPLGLCDWGNIGTPPSGIPVVEHPWWSPWVCGMPLLPVVLVSVPSAMVLWPGTEPCPSPAVLHACLRHRVPRHLRLRPQPRHADYPCRQ